METKAIFQPSCSQKKLGTVKTELLKHAKNDTVCSQEIR